MPKKKRVVSLKELRERQQKSSELPDNTVFWTTIAVVVIFIIVLSAVLITRYAVTGRIVQYWEDTSRPFANDPVACRNVPPCGAGQSFMCCSRTPVPGWGNKKCTAPVYHYASEAPKCPDAMPYACGCPEKFQYRQSRPIPFS